MDLFFVLLRKILPLYSLILLFFVSGKLFKINREIVAKIIIYLIVPLLVFTTVASSELNRGNLSLPLVFFLVGSLISFLAAGISKIFWRDNTSKLLAFSSGTAATGYFGVPIALALFGKEMASMAVMVTIGIILFENSVGVYHLSRGRHNIRSSILRLIKLPAIWAFLLAIVISKLKLFSGDSHLSDLAVDIKNIYVIFGMAMIGFSLAALKKYKFDFSFLISSYLIKFVLWPIVILALIALDKATFHIFSYQNYQILILMSLVPVAVNTVAYATEMKAHPEKAAMAIITSIIISLSYIPLMVGLLIK